MNDFFLAVTNEDIENEPPLLEELGINFSHIKEKTIAVLNPVGSVAPDVSYIKIINLSYVACC